MATTLTADTCKLQSSGMDATCTMFGGTAKDVCTAKGVFCDTMIGQQGDMCDSDDDCKTMAAAVPTVDASNTKMCCSAMKKQMTDMCDGTDGKLVDTFMTQSVRH